MSSRALTIVAGVLAAALVAATAIAVVQTRRLGDLDEELTTLTAERDELQLELDRLAGGPDADPDGPLEGLLDGLLGDRGDELDGLLDGMLDGLLGDGGLLDGLAAPAQVPGAACLTPDGSLDGLLDDPLGELGGLLGGGVAGADDPDELVRTIAGQVAELRELTWREDVEVAFLDDAATRQRLEELVADDLDRDRLEADRLLLVGLGALPADVDLEALRTELLGDQVAGFYVPETGELVVRVPDGGTVRPVDQVTVAHELLHALADQTLGLPDPEAAGSDADPDAWLGALGVVEGDATLVMSRWALEHLDLADQLALATDPAAAAAQAGLDQIPHALVAELLYPYTDGLEWACRTYLAGGWPALDAAYAQPPTTSAEVLFGTPVDVTEPVAFGRPGGAAPQRETSFGAAPLLWLLEAPGDDQTAALDRPRERARAWAGGRSAVWTDGSQPAVGLSLVDGGTAGVPLCATIGDWYLAAFPDADRIDSARGNVTTFRDAERAAVLRCEDDDVVLGIASDERTATSIALG
jgi:hypothetical protein